MPSVFRSSESTRRRRVQVFVNQCSGFNAAIVANRNVCQNRSVRSDYAVLSDLREFADDGVRQGETVALDYRVVTNLISAPQDNIVADFRVRLHDCGFTDKAVLAHFGGVRHQSLRAHIKSWMEAFGFRLEIKPGPQPVGLTENDGDKKMVFRWRIEHFQILKWNDRQTEERVSLQPIVFDGKGHNLVCRVVGKELVCHFGKGAIANDYQSLILIHRDSEPPGCIRNRDTPIIYYSMIM
jgi:hypothetical protein